MVGALILLVAGERMRILPSSPNKSARLCSYENNMKGTLFILGFESSLSLQRKTKNCKINDRSGQVAAERSQKPSRYI